MSLLAQYRDAGVIGCSLVSLDDLLFIHLQLSFTGLRTRPFRRTTDLIKPTEAEKAATMPPAQALAGLLRAAFGSSPVAEDKADPLVMRLTSDYQCLIGPVHKVDPALSPERMALWFSWQAQGSEHDLCRPLEGLVAALTDIGLLRTNTKGALDWGALAPNIEYLVCRNMGNSVLRGRGKMSVPRERTLDMYPDGLAQSRPAMLCVSLEEAWLAQTANHGHNMVRELTVAWREYWLGHWSLPL
jgi:hypothetical protein